jgi:hypothetical protein
LVTGSGGATNVTNTTASGGTGSMRTWGSSVGTADGTVYWGRILIDFNDLLPGEVAASTSSTIGNTQGDALRLFSNGGQHGIGFEMFQTSVETVPTAHIRATIGNGTARVNGTAVSFDHTQTQLLVFKITFDVGDTSDDLLELWMNPASIADEVGLGVVSSSVTTTASTPAGAVVFRRDNGTATPWVADEFVLGTTFADIALGTSTVPESSTFSLLAGLGTLAFVASRRRRQA